MRSEVARQWCISRRTPSTAQPIADLRAVGRITGELEFVPNGGDQIAVKVALATSEN